MGNIHEKTTYVSLLRDGHIIYFRKKWNSDWNIATFSMTRTVPLYYFPRCFAQQKIQEKIAWKQSRGKRHFYRRKKTVCETTRLSFDSFEFEWLKTGMKAHRDRTNSRGGGLLQLWRNERMFNLILSELISYFCF